MEKSARNWKSYPVELANERGELLVAEVRGKDRKLCLCSMRGTGVVDVAYRSSSFFRKQKRTRFVATPVSEIRLRRSLSGDRAEKCQVFTSIGTKSVTCEAGKTVFRAGDERRDPLV